MGEKLKQEEGTSRNRGLAGESRGGGAGQENRATSTKGERGGRRRTNKTVISSKEKGGKKNGGTPRGRRLVVEGQGI